MFHYVALKIILYVSFMSFMYKHVFMLSYITIIISLKCLDCSNLIYLHSLVTIESTGALPPEVLFTEAVKILEDKCERVIAELS